MSLCHASAAGWGFFGVFDCLSLFGPPNEITPPPSPPPPVQVSKDAVGAKVEMRMGEPADLKRGAEGGEAPSAKRQRDGAGGAAALGQGVYGCVVCLGFRV